MDCQKCYRAAKANVKNEQKATVFGYYVKDPERYGVVDFDARWKCFINN